MPFALRNKAAITIRCTTASQRELWNSLHDGEFARGFGIVVFRARCLSSFGIHDAFAKLTARV